MAVVTSDFLAALFTNFRAIYDDYFSAAMRDLRYQMLVTEIPSETDTETYGWLGSVPQMSEWVDTRRLRGLPPFSYSLRNRHFEATIEIDRDTLEDDKYGLIRPRIANLAEEAAMHPERLVMQALSNGTTDLAFDGGPFFSNTRVLGESANIDNLIAGSGTTVSNIQSDLATARATMRLFQDEAGRPMNIIGNVIVCPPELEQTFYQALNANLITATAPSSFAPVVVPVGMGSNAGYEVIATPYLTDPNDWYLLSTRRAWRPLLFQNRKPAEFQAVDRPDEFQVFMTKKFYYGVDARYAVGYLDPRMAIKVVNS